MASTAGTNAAGATGTASREGCSGACCAVFPLSVNYADLVARPFARLDGPQLADMLVPLTPDEALARAERFGATIADPDRELFTCHHWDESTRLCTIYEERPDMCRRYPYGRGCDQGCDCQGTP